MHILDVGRPALQRTLILVTAVLTAVALWPESVEGAYIKLPVFVLGATLLAALILAGWIADGHVGLPHPWVGMLVLFHLLLFLISALGSFHALHAWEAFGFAISCIVFFWAGATLFPSKKETGRLFSAIEWLTAALVTVASAQFVLGDALPVNFHVGADRRVSSLLGNSAFFSSYLVVVFPILLGQTLSRRPQGGSRVLRFALLGLSVFLIFAAQARSSIAGWLASLVVFGIFLPASPKTKRILGAAGVALVGATTILVIAYPGAVQRGAALVEGGHAHSWSRRVYFWAAGEHAYLANPIFGSGIGGYEQSMLQFRSPEYWEAQSEDVVPHAHNEMIEIAVEFGSAGLLLFAVTLVAVFRQGVRTCREPGTWRRWTAAGLLASLAGIGVDNLANVSLRQPPVALLVWLCLGLLWSGSLGTSGGRRLNLTLPGAAAVAPLLAWGIFAVLEVQSAAGAIQANVHLLRALGAGSASPRDVIAECEAAVTADPADLVARSQLAAGFLGAALWRDALHTVDDLQRISPIYPKSHLMRAVALARLGRTAEAVESVQEEIRHRSHPEAYLLAADLYRIQQDIPRERAALQEVLRKDIEGRIPFGYQTACPRLVALCRTEDEKKEMRALFDSLQATVVRTPEFFRALETTGPG